jgi:hypothetical protein
MAPFTLEFTTMQKSLDSAVTKLEQVQVPTKYIFVHSLQIIYFFFFMYCDDIFQIYDLFMSIIKKK